MAMCKLINLFTHYCIAPFIFLLFIMLSESCMLHENIKHYNTPFTSTSN